MNGTTVMRAALLGAALSVSSLVALAAQVVVPTGATVTLSSGTLDLACANLTVQGTMTVGASEVIFAGDIAIEAAAALDGGTGTIAVGGNWSNAGTFSRGTGTVVFEDGCATTPAQITGNTAFTNLAFTSATGRTFVIPAGSATTVFGQLTLTGAAGMPIQIVSANPSQPTFIVLGPASTVSSTNVQLGTNVAVNATSLPRLANISTRGRIEINNDVMIGGFIISGSTPKKVLITARGPSLAAFGVVGAIADPTMQLHSGQTVIASNDNWQTNANAGEITATGIAPTNPLESAIMTTLNPGAYTVVVSGVGGGMGVGIVEVFEQDHPEVPLINISTRGQAKTGDNVMIGGFIIQGDAPKKVLITARGPSLANFGITNPLANPQLQVFSGQTQIASNDDWQANANASDIVATGVAPTSPLESAILITLNPGAYTAIVSGVGGGTGVGIVEVFAQ